MIRAVGPTEAESLRDLCKGSALGCRIWSLCRAYGTETGFSRFWIQNEDTAVGMLDGDAVFLPGNSADFEELEFFFRAAGAVRVLGDARASDRLGRREARGDSLRRAGRPGAERAGDVEENPPVREIYQLLLDCTGPGLEPPAFEPFYLDLSHRVRHGAARSAGIRREGRLAACAVAFETEGETLLSSVSVSPPFRGQGLGQAVTEGMLSLSGKEEAFLFCLPEKTGFYRRLGFEPSGNWAQWRL